MIDVLTHIAAFAAGICAGFWLARQAVQWALRKGKLTAQWHGLPKEP